jgi:hypothetical protein
MEKRPEGVDVSQRRRWGSHKKGWGRTKRREEMREQGRWH